MEDIALVRATLFDAIRRLQRRGEALLPIERMKLKSMILNLQAFEAVANNENEPEISVVELRPGQTHRVALDARIGALKAFRDTLWVEACMLSQISKLYLAIAKERRESIRAVIAQTRQTCATSTETLRRVEVISLCTLGQNQARSTRAMLHRRMTYNSTVI